MPFYLFTHHLSCTLVHCSRQPGEIIHSDSESIFHLKSRDCTTLFLFFNANFLWGKIALWCFSVIGQNLYHEIFTSMS